MPPSGSSRSNTGGPPLVSLWIGMDFGAPNAIRTRPAAASLISKTRSPTCTRSDAFSLSTSIRRLPFFRSARSDHHGREDIALFVGKLGHSPLDLVWRAGVHHALQ